MAKNRYGLEIRAAGSADASGLATLLERNGLAIRAAALTERLDQMRAEAGTVLLALEWGPPSGLVEMHWHNSLLLPHPVAEVTLLLVDPDARRRGVGRLLVKAAAQAARVAGCDALRLLLPLEDRGLSAFCSATGFQPAGGFVERGLRKNAAG